jgi:transcriptional regulator with XRE-family HTH domain
MISDKERQIQDSLATKEYREALAIEHVNTTLAVQIRKMRENHQWSQSDLADRLGKHQETISQWENPDYGRYSISTLKELASAFDVALLVKFIPFSELVSDMVNLSSVRLCPPSFDEERIVVATGIGSTPLNKEVAPSIVAFINSIPSTPSTLISGTSSIVQAKEMAYAASEKF